MKIKAIVTDMDGTFLNEQHAYNRARFSRQYEELKKNKIQFVVASGRQYYGLLSHFKDIADEITFIADNGSYMLHKGQEVYVECMERTVAQRIVDALYEEEIYNFFISGRNGSYVNGPGALPKSLEYAKNFAERMYVIESLDEIHDDILKFGINVLDDRQIEALKRIAERLRDKVDITGSGYGFMDLIPAGVSKGSAIQQFLEKSGLKDDQIAVFGDSQNDISMLTGHKYSFAMKNAAEEVKDIANYRAPSNEEEGVLEVIDQLLAKTEPFDVA